MKRNTRTIAGRLERAIRDGGYNCVHAEDEGPLDKLSPGDDAYDRLGVRKVFAVHVFFDNERDAKAFRLAALNAMQKRLYKKSIEYEIRKLYAGNPLFDPAATGEARDSTESRNGNSPSL